MSEDKTFRVDNATLENLRVFGPRIPKPGQMYLPGMEPLGPFDLWLTLGCYYLIDPKRPTEPVVTSLTEVLSILDFSQTLAKSYGGYQWTSYASDDYTRVREAFHRLRTVEFPIYGYWRTKTGRGRPKRKLKETFTGVLADYGYLYPDHVLPPDQVAEVKRRNVNRAMSVKGELGPAIYQLTDVKPEGIHFSMAREVVRALIEGEKDHIGSTIFRAELFQFRRQLSRNLPATKLLLRTCRQTSKKWTIALDKLVAQVGLGEDKNVGRSRQSTLEAIALLQGLGVIEGFGHDPKSDKVSIVKSGKWHFPASKNELDDLVEDSTG